MFIPSNLMETAGGSPLPMIKEDSNQYVLVIDIVGCESMNVCRKSIIGRLLGMVLLVE